MNRAAADERSARANVRDHGAVGDGKADDTKAIQDAIKALPDAGGVVVFPPGRYLTRTIPGKSHVTFKGHSGWGYRGDALGSTVISPVADDLACLFDLKGSIGTRLEGLTLDGMKKGKEMHGVYSKHTGAEQNIVIDDCNITQFSGSGVRLDNVWVFAIRRSIIKGNALSGIDGTSSYDGWIIDNQITGNRRGGIYGESFGSVTITANRIEWNREGGIVVCTGGWGGSLQICNCFFDRNFGPGIEIGSPKHAVTTLSITGNIFRRNGYQQEENPSKDCHLRLVNIGGAAVTGNTFCGRPHGQDKKKGRPPSPRYGMILESLTDSTVMGNALHCAALKELIVDEGGHKNSVIRDNPGQLQPMP